MVPAFLRLTMLPGRQMRGPQLIISLARQGSAPPAWRIFHQEEGNIGAFVAGTRNNPDPLPVFAGDAVTGRAARARL